MPSSSFLLKAGAVLSALSSTTFAEKHTVEVIYSPSPVAYSPSSPAGYGAGSSTSTPCTTSTPVAYGHPSSSSPAGYEAASSSYPAGHGYASSSVVEYGHPSPSSPAGYGSPGSSTPVGYEAASSSTPCSTSTSVHYDTSSVPSYDTKSSSVPSYDTESSSVPSYDTKSSSVPVEYYDKSSSIPSYETKTTSTPVEYHHYSSSESSSTPCTTSTPAIYTSKPVTYSYSTITKTYTRTYVDICSTGYTTKTTTQTVEYCPETTKDASTTAPPPGLTVTTKVCTACAATPVTVTLTVPYEITATYVKTSEAPHYSAPPSSETSIKYPYCSTCSNLTPTSSPPSYGHSTMIHKTFPPTPTPHHYTTLYVSKVSTVYLVPSAAPSPSGPAGVPPCVGEGCKYTETAPVPAPYPTAVKPVPSGEVGCSGAGCSYEGDHITMSFGTGTGTGYLPSKTSAYDSPYFTGAASSLKVGGAMAGGIAAAVAMFL